MTRCISAEVKDILEDPDPNESVSLVLVAENTPSKEIEQRIDEADGEITRELPDGVFIAEMPESRVGDLRTGDLIESISLSEALRLA
jgi:hypothetical protein